MTDPASDPQDFDFDLTGIGVPADLDLDTDAGDATLPSQHTFTLDTAQLGANTVNENVPAGWTLTDLDCTGDADISDGGQHRPPSTSMPARPSSARSPTPRTPRSRSSR